MVITGTAHRNRTTDFFRACKRCNRIFYFPRSSNGDSIICPHCGKRH